MKPLYIVTLPLCLLAGLNQASAATPFSVNAGDDGFVGWTDTSDGSAGRFLGSSGTIDTGGDSWALFANGGDTSSSVFVLDSNLSVGQTVTISASLGNIDPGGTVGIGLQNSGGTNRFEAYYRGGDATNAWKLNDAEGEENISGPTTTFASSSAGSAGSITFEFTLLAADTYSLAVNGVSVTNSALNLTASDIDRIRIFNFNAGNFNDQYFNSLTVPEPSAYALLMGISALAWIAVRRRR